MIINHPKTLRGRTLMRLASMVTICITASLALAFGVRAQSPSSTDKAAGKSAVAPAAKPVKSWPKESVEADVSARRIAVTSNFSGTRILLFGAVENSRQTAHNAGYYDLAVALVGPTEDIVARRKSNVAGIWINTASQKFKAVPSYYAVISTRPLDEIAGNPVLWQYTIGFDSLRLRPDGKTSEKELKAYQKAIVRLKRKRKLYREAAYGVAFIGKSLFRATVDLPANVTVGKFHARVFLFRNGELINSTTAEFDLQRAGFEDVVYNFAFQMPFWYGVVAVIVAVMAGLIASAVFRKGK